jgi:LuxR family transcriptional regulator, maltose regulon positive regulatory protein
MSWRRSTGPAPGPSTGWPRCSGRPRPSLLGNQRAIRTSRLVDPLTGRELEVLEMMAAGRSNQAIARELVVALDTVNKHVGHVLGKLGAANRTEAVARARELNLLP